MFRVILSVIPRRARFKRFWLPSLDYIDESLRTFRATSDVKTALDVGRVAELIRHVRIGGTNKTSAQGRLREADVALIDQLKRQPARQLNFLDVGCSDGTASIETIQLIERSLQMPVSAYLQDRYIWVRSKRRWNIVEYVSNEHDLVMVRCGSVALAPAPKAFLLAPLTNCLVSAYLGLTRFRQRMHEISRFPLLSPNVLLHPDLQICEGSVLTVNEDFVGRMDVVRVSNLLHSDYFSETELRAALSNLVRYIRDGGLLLVSRNHQYGSAEIERGTVWRLIAMRLVPVADFGGGSELKGLVARLS
jgi:SAM-dependent methyltransferase